MCPWGTGQTGRRGGRAHGRSAGGARAGVLREDAPEPPRPLGLGRSSATLSSPSCKEDRAGAWDVSRGRGGTRPRTLSLGLDAPSGARPPRTAGCYAARPVARHPVAPPGPAAGLLCVSPARRPGACPLTLPLRTHTGRWPRPAPVAAQAAVPRGWAHDAVCDVDAQPGAGAWAPPPQSTRCSTDPGAVDQEVGLGGALMAGLLSWGGAPQSPLPRGTWERAEVSPRHPVGWRLVPGDSRTPLVTAGSQPPGAPRAVEGGLTD